MSEDRTTSLGIVSPLVSPNQAVKAFNEYQKLKEALRRDGDFIQFKDGKGNIKETPTKQWRSKLTRFFGISVEVVEEVMEHLPDGTFTVRVKAKATAPNGLYQEGDGACWSKTKERYDRNGDIVGDLYHNTRSHAITRAKNRAVLELVGFGEVSAEEIEAEDEVTPPTGYKTRQSPPTQPKPTSGDGMSDAQRKFILRLAGHFEKDSDSRQAWIEERYNIDLDQTSKFEASDLIKQLQADVDTDKEIQNG